MPVDEFWQLLKDMDGDYYGRETDLNTDCIEKIENNIYGTTVLEVGCGKGFLANLLSKKYQVTACDINISQEMKETYTGMRVQEENVECLSFADKEFDTVVCTHMLEHVRNINTSIRELRRVTKKRLIIVVPKQRPYLYTFDGHLRFFPYEHDVLNCMRQEDKDACTGVLSNVAGDWYYQEDKDTPPC